MKPTIITLLLFFMSLMANADASGTCGDNLTWTYVEATKTLTISGEGAMTNYTNYDDECPVKAPWYDYREEIASAILESEVTTIGECAFYECSGLISITIPNSVTRIGDFAFWDCSGLSSITIPNSVKRIGGFSFRNCSGLTSITIPDGVTSIGDGAFYGCCGLTSITIGKSVTTIGYGAFSGCTNLEEVYIYAEEFLSTYSDAFNNAPISQADLYAPAIHLNTYRQTYPWSAFKYIFPIEGSYAERCAKPTISIKDGEIVFECETPEASYVASYETLNSSTTTGNKMSPPNRFRITVYAQKKGLLDSPVATAEVEISLGKRGDLNGDGVINVADVVSLTNMIMNQE